MHRVACLGRRSNWGCVNVTIVTPNVNVMSISYVFRRVELLLPGQPVVSCEETSISREALCFTECRSHSGVYRRCRCINLDLWLRHESDVLAQCETTRVLHHQSRGAEKQCPCLFHSGWLEGVSRASQSVKGFGNFPSCP